MGLGSRYAHVRRDVQHDTTALRAQAVNAELWHEFREGQRVQTVDGLPGVVARVEDGPVPGAEHYVVELDRGLGGGAYTASQLTALGPAQASEVHTAAEDYPELGTILIDRPDIAKSASRRTGAEDESCTTCNRAKDWSQFPFGNKGCPECTQTVPYRVSVRNDQILLDGKPHTEPGTQVYDRHEHGLEGPRYGAQMTYPNVSGPAVGNGNTKTEAAKGAVKAMAEMRGNSWEDRPAEWHKKLDNRRKELHGDEDY